MTKRKNTDLRKIGDIIYKHRMNLSLPKDGREFFLADREIKGLLEEGNISQKTLANIENGYNLPNLVTLNYLATALEIDLLDLIREIREYIPAK